MRTLKFAVGALLLLAPLGMAPMVAADEAKPPPRPKPVKQDRLTRITAAVETMEQALLDLPPGVEAENIRKALDQLHQKLDAIVIAQSDLEQAKERAAYAERMAKRKYMTEQQADAEKARLKKFENVLERLKKDLEGLGSHPKELVRAKVQEIAEAEQDLAMQQDRAAWAARMLSKGYISGYRAKSEQALVREYEIALERLKRELKDLQATSGKPAEKSQPPNK